MRILISNDDGVSSPGILALAEEMKALGEVTVVAPERERSTASHSLTLHKPLRIRQVAPGRYSTSGSPADCIYLGMREVLKGPPDLILSGINSGANLGTDVHYSGTVAAAREGALMNIRSYAFSLVKWNQLQKREADVEDMLWKTAALKARQVVEATHNLEFPSHTLINVNVPNLPVERIKGIRVARQGFRFYESAVTSRQDPRGVAYYWIGGGYTGFEQGKGCDCDAVGEGFVSVTPLTIDCTHDNFCRRLSEVRF